VSRPALAWLALAALALAAGCAPHPGPGPRAALVRVEVEARARPGPPPETAFRVTPVHWDWGLYLVTDEGRLTRLSPAGGQRLRVLETNPLRDQADFAVPPGERTLRLLVESYRYYYLDWAPSLQELQSYRRDYTLRLAPGASRTIRFRAGGP
jgi:hypothetical protein